MPSPKDDQVTWVRAVLAYLGISATELARRAGIAPSTLQRPLNDPEWPGGISGSTLAKIGNVAGLKPFEFPVRPVGFGEPEATPYQYGDEGDAVGSNVDRAVRELCRGRNGRDAWTIRESFLEISGVLPGDILIVDLNLQPKPRDIVCAQVYDWSHMKAETVFRLYEPPFLLTNSIRYGVQKPLTVDERDVVIKGVVDFIFRRRQ